MDERIETLIHGRLDGELSADEQRELDRALLLRPEARKRLAEYERIDALSASALSALLSGQAVQVVDPAAPLLRESLLAPTPAGIPSRGCSPAAPSPLLLFGRRNRSPWLRWSLPAALAAAIVIVALLRSDPGPQVLTPGFVDSRRPSVENLAPPSRAPMNLGDGLRDGVMPAAWGGSIDRAARGDVLYFVGQNGNILVLEQWRVRTVPRRETGSWRRNVRNEM